MFAQQNAAQGTALDAGPAGAATTTPAPDAGRPHVGGASGRLLNQRCQHCGADLMNHKRFYKRYRVCEKDALAEAVLQDGQLQRFCQQCGRFHPLSFFDATMRTCREQLARHASLKRKRRREKALLRAGQTLPEGGAGEEGGRPRPLQPLPVRREHAPQTLTLADICWREQQQLAATAAPPPPPPPPLPLPQRHAEAPQLLSAHQALEQLLLKHQQHQQHQQTESQTSLTRLMAPPAPRGPTLGALLESLENQPSVNSQPELQQALFGAVWSNVDTPPAQVQQHSGWHALAQAQHQQAGSHWEAPRRQARQPQLPQQPPSWWPPAAPQQQAAPAGVASWAAMERQASGASTATHAPQVDDMLLAGLHALLTSAAQGLEQARQAQAAANSKALLSLLGQLGLGSSGGGVGALGGVGVGGSALAAAIGSIDLEALQRLLLPQ